MFTCPLLLLRERGDDCRHVGRAVVVLAVVVRQVVGQVRVLLPDLVQPGEEFDRSVGNTSLSFRR